MSAPAHERLSDALATAQANFPPIAKAKHSPAFGGYDYADLAQVLAAVRPCLAAQGIAIVQRLDLSEQGDTLLVTELLWRDQRETSRIPLKLTGLDNQKQGIVLTYWRRYSVLAITGAHPENEDPDGAAARDAPPPRQQTRPQADTPARQHVDTPARQHVDTPARQPEPPAVANGRGWSVMLPGEDPVHGLPLQDAWTVLYRAVKGDPDADGMTAAEIQEAKNMNRALYEAVTPKARSALDELLVQRSPKVA